MGEFIKGDGIKKSLSHFTNWVVNPPCERIVCTKSNRIMIAMSSSSGSVEDKIRMLPPDLREEALHYIDELVKRSKRTSPATFRCVAEGTLAELGTRYSSVDLQHKALEWRD